MTEKVTRKLKWMCNVCQKPVKVGQRTKHLREKHPELKDAKSKDYFVLNNVKATKKEKQPKKAPKPKAEKKQRKVLKVKHPKPSKATKVEKNPIREEKAEALQRTNGKHIVKQEKAVIVVPA